MKVSTKGQYALIMMLDLAINYNGEYITIKSIAKRQVLSEKYLEQIMSTLVKTKFVRSGRGSKGGYKLAKEPSCYTVGNILRTIEGSLSPVAALDDDINVQMKDSVTFEVWERLNDAINNVVDSITLEELVDKHMQKVGYEYII